MCTRVVSDFDFFRPALWSVVSPFRVSPHKGLCLVRVIYAGTVDIMTT